MNEVINIFGIALNGAEWLVVLLIILWLKD